MLELLRNFISSERYIPHGHCYLWQTPLVGLHLLSDALIAIAYFSIPAMLIYFVRKRSDIPFSHVFIMFGAFIVLCGTGHLLDILTLWHPVYWLTGLEKALTALISCYTALRLRELLPQFLALRTPEQLEAVNHELEKEIVERQRAEETLRKIVTGTASVTGGEFFSALVRDLAEALDVGYVIVSELVGEKRDRLRSLAFWSGDHLAENVTYDLEGLPCKEVIESRLLQAYEHEIQKHFPESVLLEQMGAVSYMGVPLVDSNNNVIGNFCVLDIKPLQLDDYTTALMQVFAARASAELQRKWAEEETYRAYEELEFRVEQRTAELTITNSALETEIRERIAAEATIRLAMEREVATTRVILRMRQSLNLESIFSATTAELRQAIACDRVLIYRFKPDWSGELVAESVIEPWQSLLADPAPNPHLTRVAVDAPNCVTTQLSSTEVLIEDTYLKENAGGIYRQRTSYCCVPDVYEAGFNECYMELLEALQVRAYIIVPIFCGNQLWGLLATYQNAGPRQWQEAEVRIVSQIGNQLGVAVQQAELFSQTQHQAAELLVAKDAADKASRAKSEFLANMSHELRTPLNAILGFTQLMQRDPLLNSEQQQYVDIISQSGEHLLSLINDVLEMSKIEAGRTTVNESEFELRKLLYSLKSMLMMKAQSKGLQLNFNCDVKIPQYIRTDENKLRQILINLLGNAIKFTEQGRVDLRVRLMDEDGVLLPDREASDEAAQSEMATPHHYLYFEVEDTGPGIAEDELHELFQPFKQTRLGQKFKEGTGLGLRISQKFVQLMGGEISVSSELDCGSCFTFYIRAKQATVVNEPVPFEADITVVPEGAADMPSHRILVAEDNPTNRLLLVKLLKTLGFMVQEAENGQVAIARWQDWSPNLIFMDMRMPLLTGYEAVRAIRQEEAELQALAGDDSVYMPTKIIALTASAFEEQRQEILAAGCDDYVSKPFRHDELLEKLAFHLGVQYFWEKVADPIDSLTESLPAPEQSSNALDLTVLPVEWVTQFHHAAMQGNDLQCLKLIDQIPADQSALVNTLTTLVDNYQFDQIMALSEAAHPSIAADSSPSG